MELEVGVEVSQGQIMKGHVCMELAPSLVDV